jgi:hypothetical protein
VARSVPSRAFSATGRLGERRVDPGEIVTEKILQSPQSGPESRIDGVILGGPG